MSLASARPLRNLAGVLLTAAVAACAHGIPEAEPADIPGLQLALQHDPADTDLLVRLGMAHFKAGEYDAALARLQAAVDAGNRSGAALLYLGLVHEEREEWSLARETYASYLDVGTSGAVRNEIEKRLELMGQKLLQAQAEATLAREDEIAATDVATPRSVAVFPLAFNSEREELQPLIYALADMMVTDFAVSNALVVLERAQVQSLLDEMALTEAGYAEPATGARAGRLLRAEHVVQGVLTTLAGDELRTDAAILDVPRTTSAGELSETSAVQQLFDMEKALVIRTIREVLRVELTPAEEQAILDNRMDNVLAFVAYGRGLREMDRGDYAAAAASFRSAQQLEGADSPLISDALERATNMADASSSTSADLVSLAGATGETGRDGALGPPAEQTTGRGADFGSTLRNLAEGVAPSPTTNTLDLGSTDLSREETRQGAATDRQPIAETTGGERLGVDGRATIRLVIPRPGGER